MFVQIVMYHAISIDCAGLIAFATNLRLNIKQPTVWTQLQGDCCIAAGITCDITPRVTSIVWRNMNLDGVFNGSMLPSSLNYLDLKTNSIIGNFPLNWPLGMIYIDLSFCLLSGNISTSWPPNLSTLYLRSNSFTGPISYYLPSGISRVEIQRNGLSGTLPSSWPLNLTYVDASFNSITGNATTNWPAAVDTIFLGNNFLTGAFPNNWPALLTTLDMKENSFSFLPPIVWPSGFTTLILNSNILTGDISTMIWPASMIQINLDNNILSGDISNLPRNLRHLYLGYFNNVNKNRFTGHLNLNQPIRVSINFNWINNIVIANSSILTYCDLSNTPLLGNSQISGLTMCTKTNLYNASLLPNTLQLTSLLSKSKMSSAQMSNVFPQLSTDLKGSSDTSPSKNPMHETVYITEIVSSEKYSISDVITNSNIMQSLIVSNESNSSSLSKGLVLTTINSRDGKVLQLNAFLFTRLLIDVFILAGVIRKTPFLREFRKTVQKRFEKNNNV